MSDRIFGKWRWLSPCLIITAAQQEALARAYARARAGTPTGGEIPPRRVDEFDQAVKTILGVPARQGDYTVQLFLLYHEFDQERLRKRR